jgi:serine/threonine protein phosphatase PrpC
MKSEVADYTKILPRIFYSFADDFDAVILATDGITDAFFPSEQNLIDYKKWNFFWNKILKSRHGDNEGSPEVFDSSTSLDEKATSLRNWLDFWSIGNHDDRTIVIVKDR